MHFVIIQPCTLSRDITNNTDQPVVQNLFYQASLIVRANYTSISVQWIATNTFYK